MWCLDNINDIVCFHQAHWVNYKEHANLQKEEVVLEVRRSYKRQGAWIGNNQIIRMFLTPFSK